MQPVRFRPKPWPTAIAVIGVAILLGLGTWQVYRLGWKEDLLATIASRIGAAPVPLPAEITDPDSWTFRAVHADGHFANDRTLWLYGRTYDGRAGVHLLVPLIREGAPPVLVDRGFVPFDHGNTLVAFAPADGPAAVDGVGRVPEKGGLFSPTTDPGRNVWYNVDIAAMSQQTGLPLAPIYIAARPSGSDGWPAGTGGTEAAAIPNDHLTYAIFWYSMAAALAVIYVLSSRSRRS